MPNPGVPDKVLKKTLKDYMAHGCARTAARKTGIAESTFVHRLRLATARFGEEFGVEPIPVSPSKQKEFSVQHPPDEDIPLPELIARRKREFAQKAAHEEARKLIPVDVHIDGPFAILHMGDPHVDDDGTDIEALERHKKLCTDVEGLFAANVGDTTNNWVGRLARLYGDQRTSARDAWKLAEWLISGTPWLYIIAGNHDLFSGAADPIKWIARQAESLYQSSEARLCLRLPGGREVRINARHDFSGHSQFNPVHGPAKASIFGVRDHIAIAGHRHKSGYTILKDPTHGIATHAIQVSSYKIFDRYARDKGFRDQHLSPCVVTVINPRLPDDSPDLIHVFWTPEVAVDYLKFLRRKK